jgi:hypothetical protein
MNSGRHRIVESANIGQQFTQISIFGCLPDTPAERTLAQVLARGQPK